MMWIANEFIGKLREAAIKESVVDSAEKSSTGFDVQLLLLKNKYQREMAQSNCAIIEGNEKGLEMGKNGAVVTYTADYIDKYEAEFAKNVRIAEFWDLKVTRVGSYDSYMMNVSHIVAKQKDIYRGQCRWFTRSVDSFVKYIGGELDKWEVKDSGLTSYDIRQTCQACVNIGKYATFAYGETASDAISKSLLMIIESFEAIKVCSDRERVLNAEKTQSAVVATTPHVYVDDKATKSTLYKCDDCGATEGLTTYQLTGKANMTLCHKCGIAYEEKMEAKGIVFNDVVADKNIKPHGLNFKELSQTDGKLPSSTVEVAIVDKDGDEVHCEAINGVQVTTNCP